MTDAPPRESGQTAGRAAAEFARIDWSAPWLASCADQGRAVQAAASAGDAALLDALNGALFDGASGAAERAMRALTSRDFALLPVLGAPGWCAANADAAFHDDSAVFRIGRRSRAADGGAQC
ncbi:DUF3025 domain-containing protein [Burkholderia sp. BCC1999]|uniref:DUF3025 domain-containing protein n=1 Tax=Burkholderia sp. BCC1999 TaxID=2817448 RepID=UPI002AC34CE0|nr:DUF3025 domain-containing protein [Burkholderia sp. BCC1999]